MPSASDKPEEQRSSIDNLRDLLFTEIPLPFVKSPREKGYISLHGDSSEVTGGEERPDERLGRLLVERGYITIEQLRRAQAEQHNTGLPLWKVLIDLLLITPQKITEILKYEIHKPDQKSRDRFVKEALLHVGLWNPAQLDRLSQEAEAANQPLDEFLVMHQHISYEELAKAFADAVGIPFVDVQSDRIPQETLSLLPQTLIQEHEILPLQHNDREILLGLSKPIDTAILDYIGFITGRTPHLAMVAEDRLQQTLKELFPRREQPQERPASPALTPVRDQEKRVLIPQGRVAENFPVVQLVSSMIEGAINARATDIHLEPQALEMRVRYRIDGMLYDVMAIPLSLQSAVISRIKVLADMDITERRIPQDGRMSMTINGNEYHMRLATLPTKRGEALVMRILTESTVFKGLRQIGLDEEEKVLIKRLISKPYGMILVTGPIGSGKTTTLYAMLNELDILTNNIVTIEDPVEYLLTGITQVEVDLKTGITFAAGLRSILRQDADILMVGEIRDNETAKIAVRAALTGQQVFSTLHTVDTPGAITTLRNFDIQPFLIASALNGVIAQRLVRKICPHCKETYRPALAVLQQLGLPAQEDYLFSFGRGCEACYHTGYLGRTGIFEILEVDKTIKDLILNQATEDFIKDTAVVEGMRTLHQSGIRKILEGTTTPEEVMREVFL